MIVAPKTNTPDINFFGLESQKYKKQKEKKEVGTHERSCWLREENPLRRRLRTAKSLRGKIPRARRQNASMQESRPGAPKEER